MVLIVKMMRRMLKIVSLVLALSSIASAGMEEMARAGQWQRLLSVANRRAEQLPLRPEEAFVAACAARIVGDRTAEVAHLTRAMDGGPFAELASLQLAMAVVGDDPQRATNLVLPFLRGAPTSVMRDEAVEVVIEGLEGDLDPELRVSVEQTSKSLPTSLRRRLEFGLVTTGSDDRRLRLNRLLRVSTRDLVALKAARLLQTEPGLSPDEQWLVGKTLYRHALYSQAEAIFRELAGVRSRSIPSWEVAFLAGRCAFRRDRWDEAIAWYKQALAQRRSSEGQAEIQVHIARTYELAGRLEPAVEMARQAVLTRATDDRRLFLARLRLRINEPEKAASGVAKVRGRSGRSRGALLIALYDIREGRPQAAQRRLEGITRRPWSAPAAVLAAGLAVDAGEPDAAIRLLQNQAGAMGPFWASRARSLMDRLPSEAVDGWRSSIAEDLGSPDDRTRRRALVQWVQLETDPEVLAKLRAEVVSEVGLKPSPDVPVFPPGLADDLWSAGLPGEAVRWDPRGMPLDDASDAVWTAQRFVEQGMPWQAIRTADGAWRMAGSDIPVRGYPVALEEVLHPLPDPELVWQSAVQNEIPWAVLAGVTREESRWKPTVVSIVGARGLMQLMPSTATVVAESNNWPVPDLDELFDPVVSLDLGGAEISRLVSVFDGQLAPAVAAYNAGEVQARIWLEQCGSPCLPEVYVGNITFSATNGYTQDVLSAAEVYVDLYGAVPRVVSTRAVGGSMGPERGKVYGR